ncbi:MAG: YHS domain-containing protein [Candidatus Krumholzibacteriota bacterium]|nr:YHS domain-containing protein [Candidatus Krumholzibacteriota bacterium]
MVASVGCGKKQEEQKTDSQTEVKRVKGGYLIDPVDKQMIDVENSQYSYVYKEIEYKFNSKENMEAFMKDPEKYLAKK